MSKFIMLKYFKPLASKLVADGSPAMPAGTANMAKPSSQVTCCSKRQHDEGYENEKGNEFYPSAKKLRLSTHVIKTSQQPRPFFGLPCRKLSAENLDCDYVHLYGRGEAKQLFDDCERELVYFTGDLARVQVYGKWHSIPRKQVAHGDSGLSYKFSGVTVPANPWTPLLLGIRNKIEQVTGQRFNFVLVNRYKDGTDYIGEHRDDEKELVQTSSIASLTLGQPRDFVFRHGESRGKHAKRNLTPMKIELENGSLLMMNYPTNVYWYHSLPVRKKVVGVRINMTFRSLKT